MGLILVALVVAAVVNFMLLYYGNSGYAGRHMAAFVSAVFLGIATVSAAIVYVFAGWNWIAAEHKTSIINREYATTYSREEVFFASDVIETIRQLDRKRYEVNGNLMGNQPKTTKEQ